jgi:cell division protein FtsL
MSAVALDRPRGAARSARATDQAPDAPVMSTGRRSLMLALGTALVIVAAVFGVVGLTAMAVDKEVEARSLERSIGQAERRYAELIAEVATKEDPSRIRERALELGLVPSPAARHLVLSRGLDADGARRRQDDGLLIGDPLKPILTQER